MDGLLVDSENAWIDHESDFLERIMGKEISSIVGDTTGVSTAVIHERAKAAGFNMSLEDFTDEISKVAFTVYDKARITPNINKLGNFLLKNNFKLAIVSASHRSWIDKVLPRLSFKDDLTILSLAERIDLKHKPNPDGYLEMMKILNVTPDRTIVLEDSNLGIKAGLSSGAYTIALSQNLIPGYDQIKANANCKSILDVIEIIKSKKSDLL